MEWPPIRRLSGKHPMKGFPAPKTTFLHVAALCLVTAFSGPAVACGWWGDGEMNQEDDATAAGADGKPLEDSATSPIPAGLQATRVPGKTGYGIAVFRPDLAVPYLRATNGRKIARIGELKAAGFAAVIDLGAAATARPHKAESEALGMRYVSIPTAGAMPTEQQVALFSMTIGESANRPLVVFSPESSQLGDIWVLHRLGQGAPLGTAFGEGLAFGVSRELEESLAGRPRVDR